MGNYLIVCRRYTHSCSLSQMQSALCADRERAFFIAPFFHFSRQSLMESSGYAETNKGLHIGNRRETSEQCFHVREKFAKFEETETIRNGTSLYMVLGYKVVI